MEHLFNLATAISREAKRRLKLLGNCARGEYNYDKFYDRAHTTLTSIRVLKNWQQAYQLQGLDGLKPTDWPELDEKAQAIVLERYSQLGELADAEVVTVEQIARFAEQTGWRYKRAEKWVRRYRVGGLWALAPRNSPEKPRRPKLPKRDLATLDEAALKKVYSRREILGELADKDKVSEEEVKERAKEMGVSARAFWNYLADYRQFGLAGLAPRCRSDQGTRHGISDRMTLVIEGIRLSKPDLPVRAVYEAACEKARLLGESEPTEWQVRNICDKIHKPVRLLADGRENEFRNKYRLTYRMRFDGTRIVYQFDHTPVDVLVKDLRRPEYRTTSGEIRPWLTLGMDSSSRLVMAAIFSYDRPDRFAVAAGIRNSLLVWDDKPYGGCPDEIWVDNGKELLSHHVEQLTRELGIMLQPCAPHQPQLKGIVERFFETLNTRLWATLPGYVASNTVERNPKAKAELTLAELVSEFWAFIGKYYTEVHSQTNQTPLMYWVENCYAEPVDPRKLDILLMEPTRRRVIKEGIKYEGRKYWHTALSGLVGQSVIIRVEPSYSAPDQIEVFDNNGWVCTAFATDSEMGKSVTRIQVASAQREQRQKIRNQIEQAREALQDAEREIEASSQATQAPEQPQSPPTPQKPKPPEKTTPKKGRKPDLLDRLAGLDK